MQGAKGLIYLLFVTLLIFSMIIAALQWNDIVRLKAVSDETARSLSGLISVFVKDAVESGSVKPEDQYALFNLARTHGIHRIIIYDGQGKEINDTLGRDFMVRKPALSQEDLRAALEGREAYGTSKEGDIAVAVSFRRVIYEGRPYVLSVMTGLPSQEGMATNVLLAFAAGGLIFLALLYSALRAFSKAQAQEQSSDKRETSEVGFVVDTFHGLVAKLKEKERELESLRKSAEDRADIIESYSEYILESVTSGVLSLDRALNITRMNSAAERILETARAGAIGKTVSYAVKGQLAEIIAGREEVERGEAQFIAPSGKRLWLGFTLTPLFDKEKNAIGKLFVFTDLTELKALEAQAELRQRLSSLGEMAAGIAHELRNPMAVIAGYARLLGRQVEGQAAKTVEAVSKEVVVMDKIISDFLSFARPAELNLRGVNLRELISECSAGLHPEDRGITLDVDVEASLELRGDPVLLRQAFTNLLQNAAEAMESGGKISVSARPAGGAVEVIVADTGHGIPLAIKDRIFLPFYTTKGRGTGLGLAIVHRIIVQHGGSIEALSAEGQGAVFRLRLPL